MNIDRATRERVVEIFRKRFLGVSNTDPEKLAGDTLNISRTGERYSLWEEIVGPLEGKKLLEIGSGLGMFLLAAKNRGIDATGIEPDRESLEICAEILAANSHDQRIALHSAGEKLPFEDETFDIIYSTQVLEHVQNPGQVLSEAVRVLKKGGQFNLIVPNYGSFFEGHYGIFWVPYIPKWLARFYVRLWGRDPRYLSELGFINPINLSGLLKAIPGISIEDWSWRISRRRLDTLDFSSWAELHKLKVALELLSKLGLKPVVSLLLKAGFYNPIILNIRKTGN